MYYVILGSAEVRNRALASLRKSGVGAIFHYVPLHSSPAGRKLGRAPGELPVTDDISGRLLRLPFWIGLDQHVNLVVSRLLGAISS
jgi:dTDP-4-amino-4,6-dideoxygalactose transaminase